MPRGYFVDIQKKGENYVIVLNDENTATPLVISHKIPVWLRAAPQYLGQIDSFLADHGHEEHTADTIRRKKLPGTDKTIEVYEMWLRPSERPQLRKLIGQDEHYWVEGLERPAERDFTIIRCIRPFDYLIADESGIIGDASQAFRPSFVTLDIETYAEACFPDPGRALKPIVTIGLCTKEGARILHGEEKQMLKAFEESIRDINPDLIIGWNSDGYDWPYILNRAEQLDVPLRLGRDGSHVRRKRGGREFIYHVTGRSNIDLCQLIWRLYVLPTRQQDSLVRVFLGKEPLHIDYLRIPEYVSGDMTPLLEYATSDVKDLYDICERLKVAESIIWLAQEFSLFPEQLATMKPEDVAAHYLDRQVFLDGYMLRDHRREQREFKRLMQWSHRKKGRRASRLYSTKSLHPKLLSKMKETPEPVRKAAQSLTEKTVQLKDLDFARRFLMEISCHLPALVTDYKYAWHQQGFDERYLSAYTTLVCSKDPEYADYSRMAHSQPRELDIELEGDVLVTENGFVALSNGLLYQKGHRLIRRTEPRIIQECIRHIIAEACKTDGNPKTEADNIRSWLEAYFKTDKEAFLYSGWLNKPLGRYSEAFRQRSPNISAARMNNNEPFDQLEFGFACGKTIKPSELERHRQELIEAYEKIILERVAPILSACA